MDEHEQTPDQVAKSEAIKLIAMLIAVSIMPIMERLMSDPDIAYRMKWHGLRLRKACSDRARDLSLAIESSIGLLQIQTHLRHKWKEAHDHTS